MRIYVKLKQCMAKIMYVNYDSWQNFNMGKFTYGKLK